MSSDRNFILERLKSKKMTREEFNYDMLQAPPLSMFFSPWDIEELHSIATSLKYSAKPEVRYKEIDRVCRSRGLIKFGAGTNRVVYRHPEFPDILFKIAADNIGMGDNPAEFRNQFLLKPFVAKTFEVSPCGTVAIVERVKPILSREEYLSVIDDVFELITEWLIGEYVLADIGTRFFLNVGIRRSFGVVLLDYPYVYKLDGNKLYCNAPNPTSPTGKCDGVIDYDDGFNYLVCQKCGAVYKAKELELKIKESEIIRKGDIKMKITVTGGSKNINKKVNTETGAVEFAPVVESAPVATKVEEVVEKAVEEAAPRPVKTVKIGRPVETATVVAPKIKVTREVVAKEVEPEVVSNIVTETVDEVVEEVKPVEEVKKYVNGASGPVKTKSVVSFSEELKNTAEEVEDKSPVENIERTMKSVLESLNDIDLGIVKYDLVDRVIDKLVEAITSDDLEIAEYLLKKVKAIYEKASDDDKYSIACNGDFVSIATDSYTTNMIITNSYKEDDDLAFDFCIDVVAPSPVEGDDDTEIFSIDDNTASIEGVFKYMQSTDDTDEDDVADEVSYRNVGFYNAQIFDIKNLVPSESSRTIILPLTDDGNYLTKNGTIVAIDIVDNKAVDNCVFVSKEWYDSVYSVEDEDIEEEINTTSTASVGMMSPAMTEEEFLNKIEEEENSKEN